MEELSLSGLIDTLGEMLLELPDNSVVLYFLRDDNTVVKPIRNDPSRRPHGRTAVPCIPAKPVCKGAKIEISEIEENQLVDFPNGV